MNQLTLNALHNPDNITSIYVAYKGEFYGRFIESDSDQRFQVRPGSYELWQSTDTGIIRVQRWLRKSVIMTG